ncbi:MAG: tRNA preQ1(34) S-adenosylmethionine ribosyltransferase-isomerase QueA [Patescibacteria group bacterium]
MSDREFKKLLARYDYKLPPDCIASTPASLRDSAKLMVYNRRDGSITDAVFRDLPKFLPKGALLVFNETKVVPARLALTKSTGGAVRILFIDLKGKRFRVLADRAINANDVLFFNDKPAFRVCDREGSYHVLTPVCRMNLKNFLERYGDAPLPPYIKNSPLTKTERRRCYQTVFAKTPGSIAAPTASLHFTTGLLRKLKKSGIETVLITLHVGLGTFAPLKPENFEKQSLHEEEFSISAAAARAINKALRDGRPIIAVGTTTLRALESVAHSTRLRRVDAHGNMKKLSGKTSLFIREGYNFRIADGIITNFHVQRSSILMLVSAFAGREHILKLYRRAIKKDYRFFSFGDGMLIL